jgi:Immunoglobulin V-set domain
VDVLTARIECVFFTVSAQNDSPTSTIQVIEGQKAVIPCSTSFDSSVVWYHAANNTASQTLIYISYQFVQGHGIRYSIGDTSNGDFSIIIPEANKSDNGEWNCEEDDELGPKKVTKLIVSPGNCQCPRSFDALTLME